MYQNRYIIPYCADNRDYLRLFDFDPLRVRKEKCDRANSNKQPVSPTDRRRSLRHLSSTIPETYPLDGDIDGINLVTRETVLRGDGPLLGEMRTGSHLPYLFVDKFTSADCALLDADRIVTVQVCFIGSRLRVKQLITDNLP